MVCCYCKKEILGKSFDSVFCSRGCGTSWGMKYVEWRNPEYREKMNSITSTASHKEKRSKAMLRWWSKCDPNIKIELLKRLKRTQYETGYFVSCKSNKPIYYRSGYERRALVILESNPSVKSIDNESLAIPYIIDGIKKHYIPDLLITKTDNTREVIEVKPNRFALEEHNLIKFKAAANYCYSNNLKFSVWTEEEL